VSDRRTAKVGLGLVALLLLALAGVAMSGCALSKADKARLTATTLADVGLAAGKLVATINEQHEAELQALVVEDLAKAKAERVRWRGTYDHLDQAVKVYGVGVTGLRAGVELAAATGKLDLAKVLAEAAKLIAALKAALGAFGIELPGGGLL
jgi:hypothetical protein